jgi:hypothetical protein
MLLAAIADDSRDEFASHGVAALFPAELWDTPPESLI